MTFWVRAIRSPLRLLPPDMVLPILTGRLRGRKWIVGSCVHSCWIGSYEFDKQRAFAEVTGRGATVLDLGSNVGFYTLLAAELVGSSGHVYAFEPVQRNIEFLRRHIALNKLKNVTVIEAAICESTGRRRFQFHKSAAMGHLSDAGQTEVSTVTLDDFVFRSGATPNSIKIDVEGAELSVLQGAREMLSQHRPALLLATHSRALRVRCLDLISEHGYVVRAIGKNDREGADEFLAIPPPTLRKSSYDLTRQSDYRAG
jgi:FkbM family methyltransferase